MKNIIFYTLYLFIAIGLFVYYLFPADAMRDYLVQRFNDGQPDYMLSVETLKPAFPPGVDLQAAALDPKNGSKTGQDGSRIVTFEHLKLSPNPLSVIGDTPKIAFNGRVGDGKIEGVLTLKKADGKAEPVGLDATIKSVHLEKTDAVKRFAPVLVKGILNGTINYAKTGEETAGKASWVISAGGVSSSASLFKAVPLKELTFAEIHGKIALENSQSLRIETIEANGNDASGTLSGAITLQQPFARSGLNLNGTLKPHPALLAKLGKMVNLLFKNKAGQNIPFALAGTVEQPKFSLK